MADEMVKNEKKCPCKKWFSTHRKLKITAVTLVLVFLILLFLPGLVIQHVVPSVAGSIMKTKVEIGPSFVNIFAGTLRIRNFKVYNLPGYAEPELLSFKQLYVNVGIFSLLSNKIIIEEILVDGLNVDLEFKNLTTTNLSELTDGLKSNETTATGEKPKAPETQEAAAPESEKKMVIKLLNFVNGEFVFQGVAMPLPDISMTDVGDGRPIGEIFQVMMDTISDMTMTAFKAVSGSIKDLGNKLTDSVKDLSKQTGESAKDLGKQIGDGAKSTGKKIGKELESIFK